MKRFVMAIALACVISVSAFAGDIHSVGAPAPQSPGEVETPGAPAPTNPDPDPGEMGNGLALMILDLLF